MYSNNISAAGRRNAQYNKDLVAFGAGGVGGVGMAGGR